MPWQVRYGSAILAGIVDPMNYGESIKGPGEWRKDHSSSHLSFSTRPIGTSTHHVRPFSTHPPIRIVRSLRPCGRHPLERPDDVRKHRHRYRDGNRTRHHDYDRQPVQHWVSSMLQQHCRRKPKFFNYWYKMTVPTISPYA